MISDGATVYRFLSDYKVNHQRQFTAGDRHINNIESFWSIVTRGLMGQFHWVSKRSLDGYLAEFAWRFNRRWSTGVFDALMNRIVVTA